MPVAANQPEYELPTLAQALDPRTGAGATEIDVTLAPDIGHSLTDAMARMIARIGVGPDQVDAVLGPRSAVPMAALWLDVPDAPFLTYQAHLLTRLDAAAPVEGPFDPVHLQVRFLDGLTRHRLHYAPRNGRLELVDRGGSSPPWVHTDGGWLGLTYSLPPVGTHPPELRHGTLWDHHNRTQGDDAARFREARPGRVTLVLTGDDRAFAISAERAQGGLAELFATKHAAPDLNQPVRLLQQAGRYQYRSYVDVRVARRQRGR